MKTFINEEKGKQWTVEVKENIVETTIGKIGEKGCVGTRGCIDNEAAIKKMEDLIKEKEKQGFVLK